MIYAPILPPWVAFYLRLPRPAKRALWVLRVVLTLGLGAAMIYLTPGLADLALRVGVGDLFDHCQSMTWCCHMLCF
jgi:hypothetical protein